MIFGHSRRRATLDHSRLAARPVCRRCLDSRGDGRRIISMRYGHADEEAYYEEQMD
jgi:hypothetical protein